MPPGDGPSGARRALLVATASYDDPGLAQLRAPAGDVEALADVLATPAIGGVEVRTLVDRPTEELKREIEEFFADARRNDLLLLYVSGHGVLSQNRRFYFATSTTRLKWLRATAIEDSFVNDVIGQTRARSVVLVLDCCHSGAFARGLAPKSGLAVDVEHRFEGRGRVTLTASTELEYAFEEHESESDVSRVGAATPGSLFTRYLVEGLATGDADVDADGDISVDELYEYVCTRVRDRSPNQTPGMAGDVRGEILIARSGRARLPAELLQAVENPLASVRIAAIDELGRLRASSGPLAGEADATLRGLLTDDSRRVSDAAERALGVEPMPVPEANVPEADVPVPPPPPEVGPPPAPPDTRRPAPGDAGGHDRSGDRRVPAVLAAVGAVAVVAAVAAIALGGGGGEEPTTRPETPGTTTATTTATPTPSENPTPPRTPKPARATPVAWDFDGDGRQEAVLSISSGSELDDRVPAGVLLVHRGPGAGIAAVFSEKQARITGAPRPDDAFGSSVASADFDRDGRTDLAVGAPGRRAVAVLYATPGGALKPRRPAFTGPAMRLPGGGLRYGDALAAGDLNGDGFADLAIGAPGAGGAGVVQVLAGGRDGVRAGGARILRPPSARYAGFGTRLRIGDLDDDRHLDLLAGAPDGAQPGHGLFCRGTTQGPRSCRALGGGATSAMAVGDVNGDGITDLVQGDGGAAAEAGEVRVWLGRRGHHPGQPLTLRQGVAGVPGTSEGGDRFGNIVDVRDLDLDRFDDILIAAPGENGDAGRVTIVWGARGGVARRGNTILGGDVRPGTRFGSTVAALGFSGAKRRPDVVVTVEGATRWDDAVRVFSGARRLRGRARPLGGLAGAIRRPPGAGIRIGRG